MSESSRVLILVSQPGVTAHSEGRIFSGWDQSFIEEKLKRAGIHPSQAIYEAIRGDALALRTRLSALPAVPNVCLPLDEVSLEWATGLRGLAKWHLSPLDARPDLPFRKVIPTFSPEAVKRDFHLGLYVELAFRRAREECETREYARKPLRFKINPPLAETMEILRGLESAPRLAVDFETGRGQINTVGFAWSPSDAIAIQTLPDRCGAEAFLELWRAIARVLEGPSEKIMQNGIYEILYAARYGIRIRNFGWDTMVAQKFLWPEFDKGLDNVGRFYTRQPYWKDDGRALATEGKRKDWGNIRDWPRHFDYNCKDTTGTYEAAEAQEADLSARSRLDLFRNYIMKMHPCAEEMCLRGLPLDEEVRQKLVAEAEAKSAKLLSEMSAPLNPKSPKQKLAFFKAKGYKIPKKRVKGKYQETTDELALKKMRLAHPEDLDIQRLLQVMDLESSLSKYLRVSEDTLDKRVRYTLYIDSTETGRWSGGLDPLGRGFNSQTLPKYAKKMLRWSPVDARTFVEVDLRQAESRFVAYDCADANLIGALEDGTRDIHSEVGGEIFGVPAAQVKKEAELGDDGKRQLGKKSGHGANYDMGVSTFQDSCLKEMDLVLDKKTAAKSLEAYHTLFPGVRRGHQRTREILYRERKLENPLGRIRYFYGRMDDATFREAYAYRPQSTIPDITSHLMLALWNAREKGELDFWLHNQCHDSLLMSCAPDQVQSVAEFCLDLDRWHPVIMLPAGQLRIPTEVKFGICLGELEKYRGKK